MIKVVGLVRRRSDMTRAAFRDYWLTQHVRLEKAGLASGSVRRIVANFVGDDLVGEAPFDGMVELYYDSEEAMRRSWSGGSDEVMKADEANFCDPDYRIFFVSEEVDIADV